MELAKQFANDVYPLLLLARRVEKMEALNLPNTICKKADVSQYDEFEKELDFQRRIFLFFLKLKIPQMLLLAKSIIFFTLP